MSAPMRIPAATLLALALAACQKGPPASEMEDLVRRYNSAVAEAYRTGDFQVAQPLVGADELRRLAAHIGVRLDQGITMDARLVELRFEGMERKEGEVVVATEERWHYLDRKVGTGQQVGQDSKDHYRMRYHIVKAGDRWVVDHTEFAEKPEVGRTEVPDKAPASAFHGMDATPTPREAR